MNEETNTQALQSVSSTYGALAIVRKCFTIEVDGTEISRDLIVDLRIEKVVRGFIDNFVIRMQDALRINNADKEDLRVIKRARREAVNKLLEERQKEVTCSAILRAIGKDPDALPGTRSRKSIEDRAAKMTEKMSPDDLAKMIAALQAKLAAAEVSEEEDSE